MGFSPFALVLMAAFGLAGLWFAFKVAPLLDRFFGAIWRPACMANRAEMLKRMKELCVDGTMPEDTAVMMAAKENGVTERELLEAFGALSARELKAMMTGQYKPLLGFKSVEDLFKPKKKGKG